jgi:hypothetical protein
VSSMKAFQRAVTPTLRVELPMASVMANNPDPAIGEECRKDDLDTTVGECTISPDLKVARILSEVMAAT